MLDKKALWVRWNGLVNMTAGQLRKFLDQPEAKGAGLSRSSAKAQGIRSGHDSARALLKMLPRGGSFAAASKNWTTSQWDWAKRQVAFISRMRGVAGPLRDDKGRHTRKALALLLWGHNPEKGKVGADPDIVTPELAAYRAEELGLPTLKGSEDEVRRALVIRDRYLRILGKLKERDEWYGDTAPMTKRYTALARYRINEAESFVQETTNATDWTKTEIFPEEHGVLVWKTMIVARHNREDFRMMPTSMQEAIFSFYELHGSKIGRTTAKKEVERSLAAYEAKYGKLGAKVGALPPGKAGLEAYAKELAEFVADGAFQDWLNDVNGYPDPEIEPWRRQDRLRRMADDPKDFIPESDQLANWINICFKNKFGTALRGQDLVVYSGWVTRYAEAHLRRLADDELNNDEEVSGKLPATTAISPAAMRRLYPESSARALRASDPDAHPGELENLAVYHPEIARENPALPLFALEDPSRAARINQTISNEMRLRKYREKTAVDEKNLSIEQWLERERGLWSDALIERFEYSGGGLEVSEIGDLLQRDDGRNFQEEYKRRWGGTLRSEAIEDFFGAVVSLAIRKIKDGDPSTVGGREHWLRCIAGDRSGD